MRHFLTLKDLSPEELRALITRASELKANKQDLSTRELLRSRCMVMIFEKSSTRTRVSFEVACAHFGGTSIFLSPGDSQMSRGESVSDTARIVSSMADLIVMRTGAHTVEWMTMAEHSTIPVINALSDEFHPANCLLTCKPLMSIGGISAARKWHSLETAGATSATHGLMQRRR